MVVPFIISDYFLSPIPAIMEHIQNNPAILDSFQDSMADIFKNVFFNKFTRYGLNIKVLSKMRVPLITSLKCGVISTHIYSL